MISLNLIEKREIFNNRTWWGGGIMQHNIRKNGISAKIHEFTT